MMTCALLPWTSIRGPRLEQPVDNKHYDPERRELQGLENSLVKLALHN